MAMIKMSPLQTLIRKSQSLPAKLREKQLFVDVLVINATHNTR